jgi:hypothetical protein
MVRVGSYWHAQQSAINFQFFVWKCKAFGKEKQAEWPSVCSMGDQSMWVMKNTGLHANAKFSFQTATQVSLLHGNLEHQNHTAIQLMFILYRSNWKE